MNRQITLIVLMFVAGFCVAPPTAHSATGPANVYKVTVTTFEVYNGTSWVTVSSGSSTTIDIASVNAGASAGTFFSGLVIPDGTYTQVRVTPSATFTVKGRVGTTYTTASISNGGCVPTAVAAEEAECTVSVPGGLGTPNPDVLPTPLTVSNGVPSHKVRVSFNVDNAIQDGGPLGELYPGQPTVTIAMIAL